MSGIRVWLVRTEKLCPEVRKLMVIGRGSENGSIRLAKIISWPHWIWMCAVFVYGQIQHHYQGLVVKQLAFPLHAGGPGFNGKQAQVPTTTITNESENANLRLQNQLLRCRAADSLVFKRKFNCGLHFLIQRI